MSRSFGFIRVVLQKLGHNSKKAHRAAKRNKNVGLRGVYNMHVGISDLERHVKVVWDHLWCTFPKNGHNLNKKPRGLALCLTRGKNNDNIEI